MFLSNPAKSFLASALILFSTTGCGIFRSNQNTSAPQVEEPKKRVPFETKEPENFQCEIVETAGDIVRRKRLARKGTWRRVDLDLGEKNQRALLQIDREYILDTGRGVYAEAAAGSANGQFSELTQELLNIGHHAEFQEAGREGNIVRYTVRPANGDSSEIIVHYDASIGLPVKQEFFSIEAGERTLKFMVEMIDLKAEPDADIFSIPAGFRKIAMEELLRVLNN